jgi:hypothetical protein
MKPAEAYILNQKPEYQEILYYLIDTVQHIFPEAELLYKWKIPFFYIEKKPLIYFNVVEKKKHVDLGIFYGNKLQQNLEYFVNENHKLVKLLRYKELNSISHEILLQVLNEVKMFY